MTPREIRTVEAVKQILGARYGTQNAYFTVRRSPVTGEYMAEMGVKQVPDPDGGWKEAAIKPVMNMERWLPYRET